MRPKQKTGIGVPAFWVGTLLSRRKKTTDRKRKSIYSKSEKNAIIDSLVHPLADEHWSFVIVDGVLHAVNEEDPIQSLFKFLKYNAPELLKRILKEIQ